MPHAQSLPPSLPQRASSAVELIREAATLVGLSVRLLDPEFGHLFELSDGHKSRTLVGGRSPLNNAVAARLAEDKYYTGLLLNRAGLQVPRSVRCLKPGYFVLSGLEDRAGVSPALPFAEQHGFPLVVKPNRLSHGRQVQLVQDAEEMKSAIRRVWDFDYLALVQTAHRGMDIRLDFLDGEFLVGYSRRRPPTSSPADIEILNLARGAHADVIESLPPDWMRLCRQIGEILDLRYLGIDFKSEGLDADPARATVIEVNASPLFVQLYLFGERERALRAQARVLEAILKLP